MSADLTSSKKPLSKTFWIYQYFIGVGERGVNKILEPLNNLGLCELWKTKQMQILLFSLQKIFI